MNTLTVFSMVVFALAVIALIVVCVVIDSIEKQLNNVKPAELSDYIDPCIINSGSVSSQFDNHYCQSCPLYKAHQLSDNSADLVNSPS